LQECADADGLMLFQAGNCDHQIPAKAYEYLRLRRPILALTTQSGDTATLLKETGGATILNLADEDDIHAGLPRFLEALRAGSHALADAEKVKRYGRRAQAQELASCLSDVRKEMRHSWTQSRSHLNDSAADAQTRSQVN